VGGHVHLLVSLLAAGGVALAFQPARDRLQRLANRVVYGRRATPYDALAVLSRRVAETAPSQMLLNDMVRATCDALGVRSACLWLNSGEDLRPVAAWPHDGNHQTPSRPSAAGSPLCTLPVQHEGRLLGAISVTVPPGRSLSAADRRLLGDVANQAGLVFRNLGLTADLMTRLEELRESRRRLVTAQEEERRRLERDLHDGAQQHLFGLKVGIHEARALIHADSVAAGVALERLEEDADDALRMVRALARGVSPPLLAAQGLAAALNARARSTTIDVRVSTDGVGRYPADMEAAVYFCCSEALQNAVRHARASTVRIRLAQEGDELAFAVEDDGGGFDAGSAPKGAGLQNMRDRVDVVGGTLDIVLLPEGGTVVRGRVPGSPRQRAVPAALPDEDHGLAARASSGVPGPAALSPG
jgi:signal transduction histidine kinase